MITVGDVIDVVYEEVEEDIMHLAGVPEPDFYAPIFSTSLARIQWLGVTLINTILASMVIPQFKSTLEKRLSWPSRCLL